MTYVTDSMTESTDYTLYILIGVALILALIVIAIFVLKSKMNQQLQEMKRISELLEKNGLNTVNVPELNSNMPIGNVAVADDGNNSDVVMKENEEAISEFAEELPVTDQQEFTWPEVIEEIKEEAPSIMQNANEGEFVFNGAEAVLQNETMNESFEDSFEGSFEDSFENVSFDEPLQDKGNIIIDDSAPQADISQPEQHFVSEQPIFGEFTEPAERVHIQPEQPASQPQPAPVQQQRQAQPQQPMKQRMTFDTARSGKAYNKSEIESIIKS